MRVCTSAISASLNGSLDALGDAEGPGETATASRGLGLAPGSGDGVRIGVGMGVLMLRVSVAAAPGTGVASGASKDEQPAFNADTSSATLSMVCLAKVIAQLLGP